MSDKNEDRNLETKYTELLNYSHSLESEIESLKKQLEHSKLGKTDLSSKDQVYQSQLSNQAHCITNLEDKLFNYEHQPFPLFYNDKCYCKQFDFSENSNRKGNLDHVVQYIHNSKTCNDDIKKYQQCILKMKKELKRWKHFAIQIFDMVSDALEIEIDFPKNDYSSQRQITVDLVDKIIQKKEDNSEIQRKYDSLQKQFNELNIYLNKIKHESNKLTRKTQHILHHDSAPPFELSKIEEFVKQDNFYTEPKSLLRIDNHRTYTMPDNNEYESKINKKHSSNFKDESLSFLDHIHSSSSVFDLSPKKKNDNSPPLHSSKLTQKSVSVTDVSIGTETFSMPEKNNRMDSKNQTNNIDLTIDSFSLEEVSD